MADTMDIEEVNRMRVSLGMKPLPTPSGSGPVFKEAPKHEEEEEEEAGSTLESRQEEGYENWRKVQEAEQRKKDREARNAEIKRQRDAAQRQSKLEGKGLGEADDNELDTRSWLIKQKKRQKEIEKARKREQEMAEEEAARQAQYTAKDLAGVKVGHELDSFAEGEDQILILKDSTIDQNEEDGDELENMDLREREKLQEKLELKKKKPVYNPHDVDESGEVKILAQYDEEIEGKKGKRFTLDGQGSTTEMREAMANGETIRAKPKAISLDFLVDDQPANDYLDISEIKVKKSKKKKAKSTRQKALDEDELFPAMEAADTPILENMDVDQPAAVPRKRTFDDASFVDDDDLQASLAAQRRAALKTRKRIRPEDIARQLKEEASQTPDVKDEEGDGEGGLVIDETSEFVANLQKPTETEIKRARSSSRPAEQITAMDDESDDDGDIKMSYADVEDEEDLKARIKREASESAMPGTGIDEEATISNGVGSALKLLKDRGILKTAESGDPNAIFRQRQQFLAEKHRREALAEQKAREQREKDRRDGRLDRMSAKEREEYARQQNTYRDQQESRVQAELFNKEYKPNVELKYIDEHGRSLNQKEAFKHLSHQFHGKGSGKQKTEKLLKKIEDDKRREQKPLLDASSSGMSGAAAQQIKKNRQAGVRLA